VTLDEIEAYNHFRADPNFILRWQNYLFIRRKQCTSLLLVLDKTRQLGSVKENKIS